MSITSVPIADRIPFLPPAMETPFDTILAMVETLNKKRTLIERCAYTAQLGMTLMNATHISVTQSHPQIHAAILKRVQNCQQDLKLAHMIGMVDFLQHQVYSDLLELTESNLLGTLDN
jgi:hypothetical protein